MLYWRVESKCLDLEHLSGGCARLGLPFWGSHNKNDSVRGGLCWGRRFAETAFLRFP